MTCRIRRSQLTQQPTKPQPALNSGQLKTHKSTKTKKAKNWRCLMASEGNGFTHYLVSKEVVLGEACINYSLCFSARSDYFSNIRSFAEPAVRFYEKVYLSSFTLPETREYTAAAFGDSPRIHHLSQWLYAKTFGHPYFLAFVSRQLLALAHGSLVDPEPLWPAIFKRLEHEKFRSDLAQVTERKSIS
jgi:hypothetical protein